MTHAEGHGLGLMAEGTAQTLFLAITFVWAWALWGYWVVAMPPGGLQISAAFITCAVAGGLAPSLAALAVTALEGRGETWRGLIAPLLRWRMDLGALSVALLLVPTTTAVSLFFQGSFIGPLRWPDFALVVMALVWPLLATLGEELGWRGFLLPRLAARFGLLTSALMVGFIWGIWHLPADYVALKGYGEWFWAAFLLNGPIVLTAHSIVMAWLWRRTSGGLFAAVLYHLTITASAMVTPTSASDGLPGVLAAGVGAAVMWLAAILLLFLRRGDFLERPGRRQTATRTEPSSLVHKNSSPDGNP
jgi:membrane protease YdiL (CAAX protease family)